MEITKDFTAILVANAEKPRDASSAGHDVSAWACVTPGCFYERGEAKVPHVVRWTAPKVHYTVLGMSFCVVCRDEIVRHWEMGQWLLPSDMPVIIAGLMEYAQWFRGRMPVMMENYKQSMESWAERIDRIVERHQPPPKSRRRKTA